MVDFLHDLIVFELLISENTVIIYLVSDGIWELIREKEGIFINGLKLWLNLYKLIGPTVIKLWKRCSV